MLDHPAKVLFLKYIYSEKATEFCEIFPLILTVCTVAKIKGKILQNFVTFSEYMIFTMLLESQLSKLQKKKMSLKLLSRLF